VKSPPVEAPGLERGKLIAMSEVLAEDDRTVTGHVTEVIVEPVGRPAHELLAALQRDGGMGAGGRGVGESHEMTFSALMI
jgi:hypothetical protein